MGFVFSPARGELFTGRRGGAATLNGRAIRVREGASLSRGLIGIGYSPRVPPARFLPLFSGLIEAGAMYHREGSGALSLCYVACGRLVGYAEVHINSWDCLGAIAVIEAAGGRASDFLAGEGLWRGNHLIAGPDGVFRQIEAIWDGLGHPP
jgi:myo-inositol-1(or 4)-monophosphatase